MSYTISKAITDLRSEFEGGKSLSIDFLGLLERGARNVLDSINPETLKRRVPLYGGVAHDIGVYFCPADIRVPSALYRQPNDTDPIATYMPPNEFVAQNKFDTFTIATINGVSFIMFKNSEETAALTVDLMQDIGTKVSDTPLTENKYNFVTGNGSLQRTFAQVDVTPGVNVVSDTLTTPISVVDFLDGVVLVPLVFENGKNISKVIVRLFTNAGNFYTLTSDTDSVGDNFIDGLNIVRLKMAGRALTGAPTNVNITSWSIRVETVTGTTQTVIINSITLQKTAHYYFEYYSNRMFIDNLSGVWKETPDASDLINLAQEARDILHYETVLLIAQGNTKIRQGRNGFDNFSGQLGRKYTTYWALHPSTAKPLTYNTLGQ